MNEDDGVRESGGGTDWREGEEGREGEIRETEARICKGCVRRSTNALAHIRLLLQEGSGAGNSGRKTDHPFSHSALL